MKIILLYIRTYVLDLKIVLLFLCTYDVQIERGKELNSSTGFTLESLRKDGYSAVFLGLGKQTAVVHFHIRTPGSPSIDRPTLNELESSQ